MLREQIAFVCAVSRNCTAMQFDDLLCNTVALFRENPDVLEQYQRRWRYMMVDEYQDTNRAQYRLVSLLSQSHRNLCVVGDDDQSIYRFRGAKPELMLGFEKDYPQARRTLLGILSLIKGVVLCMGALGNPAELGRLLALGAAGVIIGLAALLTRKQEKENPFDRAARKLVEEKSGLKGLEQVRCSFSSEGMTVCREGTGEAAHTTPYSSFVFVLETEDLLLPIYHDCVIILQKKDLLAGTILQLREFLSQQTQYVFVPEQQEAPLKEAT